LINLLEQGGRMVLRFAFSLDYASQKQLLRLALLISTNLMYGKGHFQVRNYHGFEINAWRFWTECVCVCAFTKLAANE